MTDKTQCAQPAHTPGPWHWEDGEEFMNMPHLMAGEAVVCHFGDDTRYYPTEGAPPSDEDARLIAAAPDLLQALAAMVTAFAWGDMNDGEAAAIKEARAAIVKATGAQA